MHFAKRRPAASAATNPVSATVPLLAFQQSACVVQFAVFRLECLLCLLQAVHGAVGILPFLETHLLGSASSGLVFGQLRLERPERLWAFAKGRVPADTPDLGC